MIWVIDASVALRWLLEDERDRHAEAVLERMLGSPERFAVPELFCHEVYAVLCRVHPAPHDAFVRGIVPIVQGGLLRYPMTESLAEGAFHFVKKGLTGYDACYASLARQVKGKWLTFDEKAHRQVRREGISHLLKRGLPKGFR